MGNTLLDPKNDFVFKRIFGQKKNVELLKSLLQSILTNIEIETIQVAQEVALERNFDNTKLGRLDILATLNNGIKVNIEMQIKNNYDTIDRSMYYICGKYHESLNKNEAYTSIPITIGIWITNYDIFLEDDAPFHEKIYLKRDYNNEIATNKIEIHYIQLPKFKKKCEKISTALEEWLTFISHENMEVISMMKNENIKKAEEELEYLSGDAAERRLAELREKAIRDDAAAMATIRRLGREEGLKEGIEKGSKSTKIETAKKMLNAGIDVNLIMEITELTKKEIENL